MGDFSYSLCFVIVMGEVPLPATIAGVAAEELRAPAAALLPATGALVDGADGRFFVGVGELLGLNWCGHSKMSKEDFRSRHRKLRGISG